MTTFTVNADIPVDKTHFETMDEFTAYIEQWNFEKKLDEGITRSKKKDISEFINI